MLAPLAFVARSQRRSRRVAVIGLGVFIGIASAVSMSFIAGARRSSSVVDRFFAAAPHYDMAIYGQTLERSAVLSLPGVKRADPSGYIATSVLDAAGTVIAGIDGYSADLTSTPDPTLRVLKGSAPDASDPLQVAVNEIFARNFHSKVGDQVRLQMFSPEQQDSVEQGIYDPTGPTYTVTITAIVRPPSDIAHDEPRSTTSRFKGSAMLLSYDFWEQHHSEFLDFGQLYSLVLADGPNGVAAVTAALPSLVGPGEEPPVVSPDERFSRRASYATPVGLETTALLALGIGVAVAALAAAVLLLRTEQRFHDRDTPGLRALGFSTPQLAAMAALRTLPAALASGAVAMVGAIALSSRYPIGIGRQLEVHAGLQVNVAVVMIGTLATVILVAGVGMIAGRSRRRTTDATASRFTIPRWLRRVGAPTDVALGAHLAFESPKGRRSVITLQGVFGGIVALVMIGAVGAWVGGVDSLYDTPARHGWVWDAAIGNTNFPLLPQTADRLAADARVAEQTRAAFGQVTLDGVSSELFAIDASGTAPPMIVDGRLPTRPNEVAIGTRMLRRLAVHVGGTVTMSLTDGEFDIGDPTPDVTLTVVGTTVAPMFGESDLGDVSVTTLDAIRDAGGDPSPRFVMARFASADRAGISAQLDKEFTEDLLTDIVPARIVNMHGVRNVPLLGIAFAAVLGAIILAYVIVAGARTHRRELAVLRAIGLENRRVRRVVLWQGALTAVVLVAIGFPLSLVAGSALWRRVASDTGVPAGPVEPRAIFLVAPASLVVAVAASLFAAFRLRRSSVADMLREE